MTDFLILVAVLFVGTFLVIAAFYWGLLLFAWVWNTLAALARAPFDILNAYHNRKE